MVFVAMIGGLIEIVEKSGAANNVTSHIAKLARTPQHVAAIATILPLFYFFDDFAGTVAYLACFVAINRRVCVCVKRDHVVIIK